MGTSRQTCLTSEWTERCYLAVDWLNDFQGPAFFQRRHIPTLWRSDANADWAAAIAASAAATAAVGGCENFPNIW